VSYTTVAETVPGALPAELRPQVVESVQFSDFALCKLSNGQGPLCESLALPAELRPQVVESVQFSDFTLCKLSGGQGPLCG